MINAKCDHGDECVITYNQYVQGTVPGTGGVAAEMASWVYNLCGCVESCVKKGLPRGVQGSGGADLNFSVIVSLNLCVASKV